MTVPPGNSSPLSDWLSWLEQLDPGKITLGLERIQSAWQKAGVTRLAPLVITVAGTNGKGSCIGFLENILCRAGYTVGSYTSPHIQRYNERIRINGEEVTDEQLVDSFARVDALRGDIPLSYFEFGTLAAFDVFVKNRPDIVLLEVGLGGRLDAVNIIDADVVLITSIDIDHVDWLGHDRESIGFEKAGVFREGKPVICADANPPASLLSHAKAHRVPLYLLGRDFAFEPPPAGGKHWSWWLRDEQGEWSLGDLPLPGLGAGVQLNNAAGVLAVLRRLPTGPLTLEAIYEGIATTRVAGRFEIILHKPEVICDVAHNPQSARALADHLANSPTSGRSLAVFGCMADKDITGIVDPLVGYINRWYIASPANARAASTAQISQALVAAGAEYSVSCDSVAAALAAARGEAGPDDRIIVFGSFYTVAEATSNPL